MSEPAERRRRAATIVLGAGALSGVLAFPVVGSSPLARADPQAPAAAASALSRLRPAPSVRNVSATIDQNEWNPRFSPDGRYLSYERRDGSAQAIFVADAEGAGTAAERISSLPPRQAASAEEALLGSAAADDSYNAQLSFFPDGRRFVFVGNGGSGVYHLYEGSLGGGPTRPLTAASKEDGHPAVSPDGKWLVYVSARSGLGKLVLRDLTTLGERTLTSGDEVDLYPAWSPDSRTHRVHLRPERQPRRVRDPRRDAAAPTPRQLTTWKFDDLRPIFSPDGARSPSTPTTAPRTRRRNGRS